MSAILAFGFGHDDHGLDSHVVRQALERVSRLSLLCEREVACVSHKTTGEQLRRALASFFGDHDRLCFANGIGDQPLLVQPAQCVPIVSLPSTHKFAFAFREAGQVQQRQHRVVNFVEVRWTARSAELDSISISQNRRRLGNFVGPQEDTGRQADE